MERLFKRTFSNQSIALVLSSTKYALVPQMILLLLIMRSTPTVRELIVANLCYRCFLSLRCRPHGPCSRECSNLWLGSKADIAAPLTYVCFAGIRRQDSVIPEGGARTPERVEE